MDRLKQVNNPFLGIINRGLQGVSKFRNLRKHDKIPDNVSLILLLIRQIS